MFFAGDKFAMQVIHAYFGTKQMSMYTGLLHSHRLFVILFLLIYLIKIVLLLANRTESLENITRKLRIPEMIISALFLLTGIGMLFKVAEFSPLLIIKLLSVVAAIPLAVIGFRKQNKILATLAVVLVIGAYGMAEANKTGFSTEQLASTVQTDPSANDYDQAAHGKALYERNCIVCHGEKGDQQNSGAKDLTITTLSAEEMKTLVKGGKNSMPPYGRIYSDAEIDAVISYVRKFKK